MSLRKNLFYRVSNLDTRPDFERVSVVINPEKYTLDSIIAGAIIQITFLNYTDFILSDDIDDYEQADFVIGTGRIFEPGNGKFDHIKTEYNSISQMVFKYFSQRLLIRYNVLNDDPYLKPVRDFIYENIITDELSVNEEIGERKKQFKEFFNKYNSLLGNTSMAYTDAVNLYVNELSTYIKKIIYHCKSDYANFFNITKACETNYILITDKNYFPFITGHIKELNQKIDYAVALKNNIYHIKCLFTYRQDIDTSKLLKMNSAVEKDIIFISEDGKYAKVKTIEAVNVLLSIK